MLQNPVFATYVIAATVMILKGVGHVVVDRLSHDARQRPTDAIDLSGSRKTGLGSGLSAMLLVPTSTAIA